MSISSEGLFKRTIYQDPQAKYSQAKYSLTVFIDFKINKIKTWTARQHAVI